MAKQGPRSDSLQKLKSAIRNSTPARLYFFYGEETFLLHYYVDKLEKLLIDELTASFNFHKFTSETFTLQQLSDGIENLPMMAENTMVLVDDVDIFKLDEGSREKLCELLRDIPEYCTVVFLYETVAWKPDKRLKKLWEVIETKGEIVEFAKQEQRDLIPWITRHFASQKKQISADLCEYLISLTGGTMTALSGEINKICAYSGADTIKKSDIDAVTEPVLDAVVFQMTDFLSQGEYGKALLKLDQLLKMQQEPIAILGAIGGNFRRIGAARILLDSGKTASELMRIYPMGDRAALRTMEAAKRYPPHLCTVAAELILETDWKMKTSYDDKERLLEMLIIELAQEARRV